MRPAPPEPAPPSQPLAVRSASGSVRMLDFRFSPTLITVNVGDTVTWVNAGKAPHNATGGGIATPTLATGKSASKTFRSAGTFAYVCTIHPQMKATVRVVAAASKQPSPPPTGAARPDPPPSSSPSASGSSAAAQRSDGPQLANTGYPIGLQLLAGALLLAGGVAARRRLTA